jgi:hypothetical protein
MTTQTQLAADESGKFRHRRPENMNTFEAA